MTGIADLYRSIRTGLAPAAKSLLFKTGALSALRAARPSDKLAILRYHAICEADGYAYASPGICISPSAFEQHVKYLSASYNVVSLPDAVRSLRERRTLPPNAVAITFDDGYADNLAAARTLARHGLTATFYITAGCMAGGQPFWPAELRYLVGAIAEPRLTLSIAGRPLELDLSSAAGRDEAVNGLTKAFKRHPIPVREDLRTQLRARANGVQIPRVMLTWDEVREMHALGMTIGSHTMTHPNLPNAGIAAAREELVTARERLEAEIGGPVTMFSYPNGGADRYLTPEIQQVVREAGYEGATTSRNAFATRASDLYALERIEVEESLQHLVFALEVERFAFAPSPRPGELE
jgi:peptidoglycan/xylan/chitin deacetylase (PgdA/CDA1 family)